MVDGMAGNRPYIIRGQQLFCSSWAAANSIYGPQFMGVEQFHFDMFPAADCSER
jgi:hypothetical protein